MRKFALVTLASVIGAVIGVGIYKYADKGHSVITYPVPQPVQFASWNNSAGGYPVDFTYAAGITTPAVVHVKTIYAAKKVPVNPFYIPDPWREFFGNPYDQYRYTPQSVAFGSGVILSPEGYIVTNNHVVSEGDAVEVSLMNKKTYRAEVIGTDPSTDLALLKIDEKNLPFVRFGNSDSLKVGEWVMAVGNPFNLTSTVTAGIVSAKARNIGIINTEDKTGIESFIQTDAAVNRGNSGGALVNLRGELIGINTAIESPTGAFAGYAFAIPVNIVDKVVGDLMKYGNVQRGFLGVSISDITPDRAKELNLNINDGVFIENVNESSGAADAGMKKGDVVVKIQGVPVHASPELQEQVAKHRPGDKISITVIRGSKEKELMVTLKNKDNNTEIVRKEKTTILASLGAEFQELSENEKEKLGIKNGLKVMGLKDGKLARSQVKEGFIITKVDNKRIDSVADLEKALENKKGGVLMEGIYPQLQGIVYYGVGI